MRRVVESGHYYRVKGPTRWSKVGWEILEKVRCPEDRTMLFVDDVHELKDVSPREAILSNIAFSPNPDYFVLESEVSMLALGVLERLQNLSKKSSRPRVYEEENITSWRGFPVVNGKGPTCVLLDAGLMLKKHQLGFTQALNILPFYYEEQQRRLLQVVGKVIPEIKLEVLLYDLKGNFWEMSL